MHGVLAMHEGRRQPTIFTVLAMMSLKSLLLLLLPLLILTTSALSSEQKIWRPQGRFGKREGSDLKLTPYFAVQPTPFRGKRGGMYTLVQKMDHAPNIRR